MAQLHPLLTKPFVEPASGIFILDCDEVLLKWIDGFRNWLHKTGRIKNAGPSIHFELEKWLNIDTPTARSWVRAFNDSPDSGFNLLEPLPGAVDMVRMIKEAGFDIRIVSKCGDAKNTIRSREENLARVFGDVFQDIICIPTTSSKLQELKRHPKSILIDDHIDNVIAGVEAGHTSVVMQSEYSEADLLGYACGNDAIIDWQNFLIRSPFLASSPAPQLLSV